MTAAVLLSMIGAGAAAEPPPALAHVSTKTAQNLAANTSHTWSVAMTNSSGTTRCLLLGAGNEGSTAPALNTASYNMVAGNLEASAEDSEGGQSNRVYVWRWSGAGLPNDTSNHDMVVTPASSTAIGAGVVEYIGVAAATAESVDTSDVDPPDDMEVTSTAGALVFHVVVAGTFRNVTEDNSQNQRVELNATEPSILLWIGDLIGVSAGTVTSGITLDGGSTRVAQACISLAKAA